MPERLLGLVEDCCVQRFELVSLPTGSAKVKNIFLKIEASFQKIDVLITRKPTQSNDAVVLRKRWCCVGKRGATEGLLEGLRMWIFAENRNEGPTK